MTFAGLMVSCRHVDQSLMAAGLVEAIGIGCSTPNSRMLPSVIGGPDGRRGFISIVVVRLPYRRWLLLVILDLPGTIAVRAVLVIGEPGS